MEQRILCVGIGDFAPDNHPEWAGLTTPKSQRRENSRSYRYAPPGLVYSYGGENQPPVIEEFESELVPIYPGGPAILGWGIVIINDIYSRVLKVPIEQDDITSAKEWETKVIPARDRASDLLAMWDGKIRYGSLLMRGTLPNDGEIERSIEIRKASAVENLNITINDQNLARGGHKSNKRGFTKTDRFWAFQYGVVLHDTVESLEKIKGNDDRVPCPNCAEDIKPQAKQCIHCDTKFKLRNRPVSVEEYISEQVNEEVEV